MRYLERSPTCDYVSSFLGHNSDGKYFVTASKLGYSCETKPRRIVVFIETGSNGQVTPVNDVEIVDVACGANHTVSLQQVQFSPCHVEFILCKLDVSSTSYRQIS